MVKARSVKMLCCLGLLLGTTLTNLGCQVSAGTGQVAASIVGKGVVNNPANKSLRFDMIKFGIQEFCNELLHRGAPLRLADGQPVIGRFFGKKCTAKTLDSNEKSTLVIQFGGEGYAWTAGTGRLGFRAQGLLELDPDFRLHEDAMYVYFRPVQVDTSDFELYMTETPLAQAAMDIADIDETKLGQAIIDAQLGRGFSAIRYDVDGHTDFALGIVDPGHRPFLPYTILSSPKTTAANGRTEIQPGQQDFIGRITVKKGEAVTLTLHLDGAHSVDAALLSDSAATPYLDDLMRNRGTKRGSVVPSFVAPVSDQANTRAKVKVPPGSYFLVLDHSKAWGSIHPKEHALPARVDYLIQIGDAETPQK